MREHMKRGNPELRIRLEPEVHDALRVKAGGYQRGTVGGVSHYVRSLIYNDLNLPVPPVPQESLLNRVHEAIQEKSLVITFFGDDEDAWLITGPPILMEELAAAIGAKTLKLADIWPGGLPNREGNV